jgi:hypothetical protein
MAYADAKARLVTHARTAAAALARPFEDVQEGLPLPRGRCVRVYYGGETDTTKMGGRYTLNSEMVGQITLIAAFWPITALDEEQGALIDAEAQTFSSALRTAVDGDSALNGNVDNTTLEFAEPDVVTSGNTRFLMILWRAVTDYAEYTIAKP